MNTIPTIFPISDLRVRQNEILASLHSEQIVLTQHGRPVAVLVSPETWNSLMAKLEDLQDALDATRARQEPGAVDFNTYLTRRGDVSAAA